MKKHSVISTTVRRDSLRTESNRLAGRIENITTPQTAEPQSLDDLAPSLIRVSGERCWNVFRKLLERSFIDDAELPEIAPESPEGEDLVLLTLAASCRIGAFRFKEGIWEITSDVGCRLLFNSERDIRPLEIFRQRWPNMQSEVIGELAWAWRHLGDPRHRALFDELVSRSEGLPHDQLPNFPMRGSQGRADALATVASAAALGAVSFSGWRWEPTLSGLWLSLHQDSPLNRKISDEETLAVRRFIEILARR